MTQTADPWGKPMSEWSIEDVEKAVAPTAEHIDRAASLWAGDSVAAYDDFAARWRDVPAMVRLVERVQNV